MRKCIFFVLSVVLLLTVTVCAAVPPVFDQADLITFQQQSDLNTYFGQIRESQGYGVNIVTTDTFDGKSAQQYAEDFYDKHIGGDGVLLVVNLLDGYWYISTNGICAQRIPDSRVDAIGEKVIDLVRDGEYYEAFCQFGKLVQVEMSAGNGAERTTHSYSKAAIVCVLIGLAAGGITTGVMAYGMRSVRSQRSAANYVCPGSLKLSNSRDIYLYSTLHKSPRPKSNSSGGSSRSRGGSGGRI